MSSTAVPTLQAVEVDVREGIGRVMLNRPEALNAWNHQLGVDLLAAVTHVASSADVRAVIVSGAGRAFSSGADLKDLTGGEGERTPSGRPDVQRTLTERYHPIIAAIRTMPKPVIAAVQGPAVGIGLSLALSCDLVVATESAYFLLAFVNIGLVPDGGSSLFVPNRVGMARAAEMAMLGERVPAAQALQWGLINRVVADAELDTEVGTLARRLADGPALSFAGIKQALNRWQLRGMDEQLALEARLQQEMIESDDFLEGVTAFTEKRAPRFTGR